MGVPGCMSKRTHDSWAHQLSIMTQNEIESSERANWQISSSCDRLTVLLTNSDFSREQSRERIWSPDCKTENTDRLKSEKYREWGYRRHRCGASLRRENRDVPNDPAETDGWHSCLLMGGGLAVYSNLGNRTRWYRSIFSQLKADLEIIFRDLQDSHVFWTAQNSKLQFFRLFRITSQMFFI